MKALIVGVIELLVVALICAFLYGIAIVVGRPIINLIPRLRNVRFADARWRSATPAHLKWLGGSFGRGIYIRSKTHRLGMTGNLVALIVTLFLFPLTFSAWFLAMVYGTWADLGPFLGIVVIFVSPLAVGYIFLKLSRRFRLLARKRRQLLTASVSEALGASHSPPILLLRSFRDDGGTVRLLDDGAVPATLESALVDRLSRRGPVIAVGRPDENLPPLGASREYVTGDWQQRVRQFISEAAIIVAILNKTPGLLWEIEQVFMLGRQDHLIIIAPDEGLFELSRRWRATVGAVSTNHAELSDGRMRLSMRKTLAIVFEQSGRGQRVICRNRLRSSYRDAIELGIWFVSNQKAVLSITPSDCRPPASRSFSRGHKCEWARDLPYTDGHLHRRRGP
jgi:hypothetical protein